MRRGAINTRGADAVYPMQIATRSVRGERGNQSTARGEALLLKSQLALR